MSDWKAAANKRRDGRHVKTDVRRASGSSKDTKRWCGGKPGREHQTAVVPPKSVGKPWQGSHLHLLLVCTVCGRELSRFFGGLGNDRPPAWVPREILTRAYAVLPAKTKTAPEGSTVWGYRERAEEQLRREPNRVALLVHTLELPNGWVSDVELLLDGSYRLRTAARVVDNGI